MEGRRSGRKKRAVGNRRTLKRVKALENRFTDIYIYIYIHNHGAGEEGERLDPLANIYFLHRHFSFLVRKASNRDGCGRHARVTRKTRTFIALSPPPLPPPSPLLSMQNHFRLRRRGTKQLEEEEEGRDCYRNSTVSP